MTLEDDAEPRPSHLPMKTRHDSETKPGSTLGGVVKGAASSMTPRERARHFQSRPAIGVSPRPGRTRKSRAQVPGVPGGSQQRVIVKARQVSMGPAGVRALLAHIRYVEREVGQEGVRANPFFDQTRDEADARGLAARCEGDRHYYRMIISPENGRDLPDLKAYIRRLMQALEQDLGTPLEWVAGTHYDTGRPHLHIIVRGRKADGKSLTIPVSYRSGDIRARAEALATDSLGPRNTLVETAARDVKADRFTPMDRVLIAATRLGWLELGDVDQALHSEALRRLVHLETRGWVVRQGQERWQVPSDLRAQLQAASELKDRQGALMRILSGGSWSNAVSRLEVMTLEPGASLVGAYVGAGPLAFHKASPQLIILDAEDGRLGHLRLPGLASVLVVDRLAEGAVVEIRASEIKARRSDATILEVARMRQGIYSALDHKAAKPGDSPAYISRHLVRLAALSREGAVQALGNARFSIPADYCERAATADRARFGSSVLEVLIRDARPLADQVHAEAHTWLDTCLGAGACDHIKGRFGEAVRALLPKRRETLKAMGIQGLGPEGLDSQAVRALTTLEVRGVFERLGSAGKAVFMAQPRMAFSGVYTGRVHLGGQPYAVIEASHAITLAPWRPGLEACRGRAMSASLKAGVVDYRFAIEPRRGADLEL